MLILASREDSFQNSDLGARRRFAQAVWEQRVRMDETDQHWKGMAMNKEDMILISVDDHCVEPPNMFKNHL